MTDVTFRSDMTVQLIKTNANDLDVARSAWVSTMGGDAREADSGRVAGLINYLVREHHSSPLEHGSFTFFVSAPLFVIREFQRHRIMSFNEESGRYKQLDPVFYVPDADRKLVQTGKTGAYIFEAGTEQQYRITRDTIEVASTAAYGAYLMMLDAGVAREVARMVLPLNLYSSMYVTVNPRSLMNFLSLRTEHPDASYPSHPQREIAMVAEQMEAVFAETMPLTHAAWNSAGRVAP